LIGGRPVEEYIFERNPLNPVEQSSGASK
jgi:hypothetical protein